MGDGDIEKSACWENRPIVRRGVHGDDLLDASRRALRAGQLSEEAMSNVGSGSAVPSDLSQEAGPWNESLGLLREWDPQWACAAVKMMTNPWASGSPERERGAAGMR